MAECHIPMSQFFEARHRRGLVCAHRGFFKSSLGLTAVLWDALEIQDYTQMIVSQKESLSKEMLEKIHHIIDTRPLIQEVYKDRFPASRDKWNSERIIFNREEPTAGPSIVIGALGGRQESRHVHHIYCDDLEGADANTSDVPNEESEFFVRSRAEPLLINPARDRITVVGTPHGPKPLVHKLKDDPEYEVCWIPLTDENGTPSFPQRFPRSWCDAKREAAKLGRAAKQLYEEQLMLRQWADSAGGFEMDLIRSFDYERIPGAPGYIRYPEVSVNLWAEKPEDRFERTTKTIRLQDLRYYIHFDPKHRDPDEMKGKTRPTTAAIVVVGISPDFHAFVVDTWIQDTGNMATQLLALQKMYEKWVPYRVTWEAVGAQKWLVDSVKADEKRGKRYVSRCRWDKHGQSIPHLSRRMEESSTGTVNKERSITLAMDSWFNYGWVHLHPRFTELYAHIETFPGEERPIDGVDALAQGPSMWKPPRSAQERAIMRKRQMMMEMANPEFELTGYRPIVESTGIPVSVN